MADMKNICRTCLDTNALKASLADGTVQAKIAIIFNFPLEIQPSLPSLICEQCILKIDEFYEFSDRVRNKQEQLKVKHGDQPLVYVKVEPWEEIDCCPTVVSGSTDASGPAPDETKPQVVAPKEEQSAIEPDDGSDDGAEEDEDEEEEEDDELDEEEGPSERPVRKRRRNIKEQDNTIKKFCSLNCNFCSEEFDAYKMLKNHTRLVHKETHVFRCCGKELTSKHAVLNHIALHINPDHFKCNICNKRYRNKNTLRIHELQVHNTAESQQYKCDQCSQTFPRRHLLKRHEKKHIQAKCDICDKTLANVAALRNHKRYMHTEDVLKYMCDICGMELSSKLNLERHKIRHTVRNPEDRVPCQMCGKLFSNDVNLKCHIKNSHNGESMTCEVCSQVYPNAKALRSHKARVHVEDKFECNVCGKRFKQAILLKEHYTMHTGEKLYSCDICGVQPNSSANLYAHKKKKHPDEWLETKKRAYASAPVGGS